MDAVLVRLLESVARPIALALVHSLWQGGVVTALVAAAMVLLRRRSSALRYGIACLGLFALLSASVATTVWFVRHPEPPTSQEVHFRTVVPAGEELAGTGVVPSQGLTMAGGEEPARASGQLRLPEIDIGLAGPWVFAGWVIGVLLLGFLHLNGWRRAQALARVGTRRPPPEWQGRLTSLCRRAGLPASIRMLVSTRVMVPTVIGWLRPVILVPAASLTELTATELELVLIHELAHIRRHDVLVNYVQAVAETLLFYHPAVWWISRRIRIEREHCCDDSAVRATGDGVAYARALSEVEHMRERMPVHAMAADGGAYRDRIRRLVGPAPSGISPRRAGLAGVLVVTLLLGLAVPSLTAAPGGRAAAQTPEIVSSRWDEIDGEWRAGGFGGRVRIHFDLAGWGECSITMDDDDLREAEDGSYRLERDAGTFILEGGRFPRKWRDAVFRADPAYASAMQDMGYEIKKGTDLLELAIHEISLDYARGFAESGYDLTAGRLVEFRIHDVTPGYVRAMADIGYDELTPGRVIEFKIHGIEPEYVRRMAAVGYDELTPDRIIEFAIHGIEPDYVERMAAIGYEELTPSRIVEFSIHGIDADYVERMAAIGYEELTPSRIVEFSIHGVEPAYVERFVSLGCENLTPSRIIEFKIHGIRPEYVRELGELGYGCEDVSPSRIVEFAIHDVSPEFIRRLRERGITDVSPSKLIEYRITGIPWEEL
jgi:Zn-dependent protease with chaperone function